MPIRRAKLKLKLLEHTEAGRRWFTLESGEAISGGYDLDASDPVAYVYALSTALHEVVAAAMTEEFGGGFPVRSSGHLSGIDRDILQRPDGLGGHEPYPQPGTLRAGPGTPRAGFEMPRTDPEMLRADLETLRADSQTPEGQARLAHIAKANLIIDGLRRAAQQSPIPLVEMDPEVLDVMRGMDPASLPGGGGQNGGGQNGGRGQMGPKYQPMPLSRSVPLGSDSLGGSALGSDLLGSNATGGNVLGNDELGEDEVTFGGMPFGEVTFGNGNGNDMA